MKEIDKTSKASRSIKNEKHGKKERNDLVLQYLPLAKSMAKNVKSLALEDATQEAIIGLIRAADGYSEDHGAAFPTYARYWITDALQQAAIKALPVHVPSGIAKQAFACKRRNIDYVKEKRSQEKTIYRKNDENSFINAHPISIKPPTLYGEDEQTWLEKNVYQLLSENMDAKYSNIDCEKAKDHLNRLSIYQRKAVYMRFYSDMTLEEIGNIMGNSREAVRQLINRGLESLRISLAVN